MKKIIIAIVGLLCITGAAACYFFSGRSDDDKSDAFNSSKNAILKLQVMTEEMPDANPDMVINQVIQILEKRLDRIGVSNYEFRLLDSQELGFAIAEEEFNPGIRLMLQSNGNLQFRETVFSSDVWPILEEIEMSMMMTDTTRTPVLSLISKDSYGFACIGYANKADMEQINDFIYSPEVKSRLKDVTLLWSAKPAYGSDDIFELIAVKEPEAKERILDGRIIDSAIACSDSYSAYVSVSMTKQGAREWEKFTGQNIKRHIAVVLDDLVYINPRVENKITIGSLHIAGDLTLEEAKNLAAIIDIDKLPVTVRIIAEKH